jgi:hypothetical protein
MTAFSIADVEGNLLIVRSILVAAIAKNKNIGVDCCTASGSNRPFDTQLDLVAAAVWLTSTP